MSTPRRASMLAFGLVLGLLLAGLLAACGECEPEAPASGFVPTHRVATSTVYYVTGPQQASPPDGTIDAGTLVKVVDDAGSYVRVEREDGSVVFVAADAVEDLDG